MATHPGWTAEEQRKIDAYVNQLDISGQERTALRAPRFKAWYRYTCHRPRCPGHRQGFLDWEFVALQRRLAADDDATATRKLRKRFLDEVCAPSRDVAFYVGNQAVPKQRVFSVLGVY